MTDPSAEFFVLLGSREEEPLLGRATGTLCFELADTRKTDRWFVSVENGKISVSRGGGDADCVIAAPKALFDRLVTGNANAMAALLRGELRIAGDYNLLVLFQRVFPGAQQKRRKRATTGAARRQK